jgi:hypothetical protein
LARRFRRRPDRPGIVTRSSPRSLHLISFCPQPLSPKLPQVMIQMLVYQHRPFHRGQRPEKEVLVLRKAFVFFGGRSSSSDIRRSFDFGFSR